MSAPITITLSPEALDDLEARITQRVLDSIETAGAESPYLDVTEAAAFLRGSKQRVYDLVHQGALTPCRDGKRLLFRRDHLAAYVEGKAG